MRFIASSTSLRQNAPNAASAKATACVARMPASVANARCNFNVTGATEATSFASKTRSCRGRGRPPLGPLRRCISARTRRRASSERPLAPLRRGAAAGADAGSSVLMGTASSGALASPTFFPASGIVVRSGSVLGLSMISGLMQAAVSVPVRFFRSWPPTAPTASSKAPKTRSRTTGEDRRMPRCCEKRGE